MRIDILMQIFVFFKSATYVLSDQISTKKVLLTWNGGVSFNVLEKNVWHQYVLNKLTYVQRDKLGHVKQLEFGVVDLKWIIGVPQTVSANGHIVQHLIANVNQVRYLCLTSPYVLLSSCPFWHETVQLSETNFIMHIMNSHFRYYYCSNK
jgi:hypothetical protein